MTIKKSNIPNPEEGVDVWNQMQVAKKLNKSPDTFRKWKYSRGAERFRRVVVEVAPNEYYARSVIRYLEGAAL